MKALVTIAALGAGAYGATIVLGSVADNFKVTSPTVATAMVVGAQGLGAYLALALVK